MVLSLSYPIKDLPLTFNASGIFKDNHKLNNIHLYDKGQFQPGKG